MKYLPLLLIAVSVIACNEKKEAPVQSEGAMYVTNPDSINIFPNHAFSLDDSVNKDDFHIKVACCKYNRNLFSIFFTNDGWITEEAIKNVLIFRAIHWRPAIQDYAENKFMCIQLAKQLKTYQSCLDYNKRMEARHSKEVKKFLIADSIKKANYVPPPPPKCEEIIIK